MKDPLDLLHLHPTVSEDGQHPSVASDVDAEAGSEAGSVAGSLADSTVHAEGGALVLRDSRTARPVRDLTMLVSWSGHTDAGQLSDQLADALLSGLPHRLLASFDVDELFDYRSRRPRVTFMDGRFRDYEGPELNLYELRDASDRPFLLLTGDEPDFQWERVAEAVLALVGRLDVSLVVLVDALGLPVPHTRPLGVTAHGSRQDLVEGISTWSPTAQIEAGLGQVLEMRLDEQGHDVVGYTLHVPHYLAGGRYPHVAVSALEYIGAAMELMLPTDELRESARNVDRDISRQVSDNTEIQGLVHRLEKNFDEHATTDQRSLLVRQDEEVPDAEELGAAVEAFLRTQDPSQEGWPMAEAPADDEPADDELLDDAADDDEADDDEVDDDEGPGDGRFPPRLF